MLYQCSLWKQYCLNMGIVHFALILPFLAGIMDGMPNRGNRQQSGGFSCSDITIMQKGWDHYFRCCKNGYAGTSPCPIDCPCQNNAKCEPEKRRCVCPAGWTGRFCQDKCMEGKYGMNCSHRCNCGDGARCDRFTGNCVCKQPDCRDRCPNGFYGADCSEKCVCDDSGCDTILGNCICKNGGTIVRMDKSELCLCSPGWQASKCDEKCYTGYYGDGCRHKCGACSENATCDHVTGHCTCIDKERCGNTCQVGYSGIKCLKRCRCPHSSPCTTQDGDCGCFKGQICVPETLSDDGSESQTSTLLAASLPAAMFVVCAVMALATKIMCTRCRNAKAGSRDDTYATVNEMEEKCLEKDESCVRPTSQCFTNKTYNSVIDILPKGMTVMHLVYDDANNPAVSHTYPRTPKAKEKPHIAKMCLGDTAGSPASLPTPLDASGEYQEYKQDDSQPEYMGLMKNAVWNFFRHSNENEDIYEEAFDCPGGGIPRINIQNSDGSPPAGNIHVLQAEMHATQKSPTNTKDSNSSLNDLSSIYSNIIICPMSINEFEESFKTEMSDATEDSVLLSRDTKSSMYSNLKYNLQNTGIKYDAKKGSSEQISEEMTDVVDHVLHFSGKGSDEHPLHHNRPRSVRRQIKSCGSEYIEAINPIYAELQFSQPDNEQESSTVEPGKWKALEHLFADDLYANLELISSSEAIDSENEGVLYTKVDKGQKNPSPGGSPTISLRTRERVGVYTTLDRKLKCGKLLSKPSKWTSQDKGKTVDFRLSPPSPSMILKSYDAAKYKTKDCARPLLSRSHSYGFDDARESRHVQSKNS
ncbi:uncharacterized protein LOC117104275 [Anneissia japonica]|uniref:uncharacterized protein LOC117104275 n=1 Tax=Anneissia japonica TaxID=1529436 RepID=UPI00142560D3|nr:uncharacterized protein LOC117104275 [Anneissia japonica]